MSHENPKTEYSHTQKLPNGMYARIGKFSSSKNSAPKDFKDLAESENISKSCTDLSSIDISEELEISYSVDINAETLTPKQNTEISAPPKIIDNDWGKYNK